MITWFLIIALRASVIIVQVDGPQECVTRVEQVLLNESPRKVYCAFNVGST